MVDKNKRYTDIVRRRDLAAQYRGRFFFAGLKKLGLYSEKAYQKALFTRDMIFIQSLSSEDQALFHTITQERSIREKVRYKQIYEAYYSIEIEPSAPQAGQDKRSRYLAGLVLTDGDLLVNWDHLPSLTRKEGHQESTWLDYSFVRRNLKALKIWSSIAMMTGFALIIEGCRGIF